MIRTDNPQKCCGCTACASICPRKAITMQPDAMGFLYPKVNEDLCTNCGLCEKVCSFNENYEKNADGILGVYAVRHKNIKEVERSRSGAMFVAITDYILANNGVVYGAGYCDHFRVAHKRAATAKERDEFRGSKYVQSDLGNTFTQVANDLKNDLWVCFSGTPCQTAGLHSFLKAKKTDTKKLLLVDIVCHGTPAPYIWRDYLAYFEKKHIGKVTEVSFRDKEMLGWASHKESFVINGKKIITDTFKDLFFKHLLSRRSCGICNFANTNRPSDITIGDFWGWENIDKDFNKDDKGVSLVLVNSIKGQQLFENITQDINTIKTTLHLALQPNLQHPSITSPQREAFEKDYTKKGFTYVAKKYGNIGYLCRMEQKYPFVAKITWNIKNRIINKLWKGKK